MKFLGLDRSIGIKTMKPNRMVPLSCKLLYKPHEYYSILVRFVYHKP